MGGQIAFHARERTARGRTGLRPRSQNLRCDHRGVRSCMIRTTLAIVTLFLMSTLVCADEEQHAHDHQGVQPTSPDDPPIKITINPEARISAVLAGALPPPAQCGTATDLSVKIV